MDKDGAAVLQRDMTNLLSQCFHEASDLAESGFENTVFNPELLMYVIFNHFCVCLFNQGLGISMTKRNKPCCLCIMIQRFTFLMLKIYKHFGNLRLVYTK